MCDEESKAWRRTFCSLALSPTASLAAPRRSPTELLLSLACSLLALGGVSAVRGAAQEPRRDSLLGGGGARALDRLRHALDGVRGLVDDACEERGARSARSSGGGGETTAAATHQP